MISWFSSRARTLRPTVLRAPTRNLRAAPTKAKLQLQSFIFTPLFSCHIRADHTSTILRKLSPRDLPLTDIQHTKLEVQVGCRFYSQLGVRKRCGYLAQIGLLHCTFCNSLRPSPPKPLDLDDQMPGASRGYVGNPFSLQTRPSSRSRTRARSGSATRQQGSFRSR